MNQRHARVLSAKVAQRFKAKAAGCVVDRRREDAPISKDAEKTGALSVAMERRIALFPWYPACLISVERLISKMNPAR
jgi:hypothetical protein